MIAETLVSTISTLLSIDSDRAQLLVAEAQRLYVDKMNTRFSELKLSQRLKRTNPFLLRIRGVKLVSQWAKYQVDSALFASEEEATGHLLEAIAKICHPGAKPPRFPDDFDYEVQDKNKVIGYQVKMSWDCMPMSSRKNLSNTIRKLQAQYTAEGKEFVGVFAPCYGRATTNKTPSQDYVSMRSREFWEQVGGGKPQFDVQVGEACALLCSEFRLHIAEKLIPALVENLVDAALVEIGTPTGEIDYEKLFRRINP